MNGKIYKHVSERLYADIDNERVADIDIVGLTQSDEVKDFFGNSVIIHEGDYVYLYTDSIEGGELSYIFSEGYVIPNPYEFKPYKWCCKLAGDEPYFEYLDEYN
ncbi:TPA: hypothetical protein MZO93_003387, partial [Salmonella enterica]|nr:hypothetical protein [Salmonella enterica]HAE1472241.1 hypothetical protein [Salmonella enterica subsp. enterica]HCB4458379.1 hypothetical protein [Salmonella enterica]